MLSKIWCLGFKKHEYGSKDGVYNQAPSGCFLYMCVVSSRDRYIVEQSLKSTKRRSAEIKIYSNKIEIERVNERENDEINEYVTICLPNR